MSDEKDWSVLMRRLKTPSNDYIPRSVSKHIPLICFDDIAIDRPRLFIDLVDAVTATVPPKPMSPHTRLSMVLQRLKNIPTFTAGISI